MKTNPKYAKKSSSFYDDYLERSNENNAKIGYAINRSGLNFPNLIPQETPRILSNSESTGSEIRKNIERVLSKKYGELDTRTLFDGIDDKDEDVTDTY